MFLLVPWWIWIPIAASTLLWIVVYFRIYYLEKTIRPLDSTTPVPDPPGGWPKISVIVPARNEEKVVGECLASLVHQDYPDFELIFVDDRSTDATLRIAREVTAGHANCRVVEGAPRPEGKWIGKNWALVQGVKLATADWLLFIDSDVMHHPLAFRKAMAEAVRLQVDALSMIPTINARSFWEKAVMPLFALLSALVEPMDSANQLRKQGSRLCGAFILIKRDAYEAVGGHEAVHEEILEDMALAWNLKQKARRIRLTYTRELTSTRMYEDFAELWTGLCRLSFPMLHYNVGLLLLAYLAAIIGTIMPWFTLFYGIGLILRPQNPPSYMLGALVAIGGLILCLATRYGIRRVFFVVKVERHYSWLLPLAAMLYCAAATWAAARHFAGAGLPWKQRIYDKPAA